jgi:uncharacterized protein YjdB
MRNMRKIKTITKIILVLAIGAGIAALAAGVSWDNKALATGESFTPINISPSISYDSVTNTVNLTGSITSGTETFATYTTCPGVPAGNHTVTGPLVPKVATWAITGSQNMSGTASFIDDSSSYKTYGDTCPNGGTNGGTSIHGYGSHTFAHNSISVSSLLPGNYSFSVTVTPVCVPSSGSVSCSPQPSSTIWSGSFTIPPVSTTPSVTGTVNVSSTNIVTGEAVVGSWIVLGGIQNESSTNATSANYTGLPLPGGIANYTVTPDSAQGYALGVVKGQNIAEANNGSALNGTLAAIRSAFASVAFAAPSCAQVPCYVSAAVSPADSQTLTVATPTVNFAIGWYPIATMSVSTSSVALDTSGNGQITVKNTGTDGSELDWTASTASKWFTLLPGSGSVEVGAPQNIAITASSTLAPGNYTGTVQITGTSKYCPVDGCTNPIPLSNITVTVTFTVPPKAVTVSSCTASVTPNSVKVDGTAQMGCVVTMSDDTTNSNCKYSSGDTSIASVDSVSGKVAANKGGKVTLTATSNDDDSKSCTADFAVPTVSSVAVSVKDLSIQIGDTTTATCTVTMSDGSTNHDCTLSSSDTSVASVNTDTGVVTGKKLGTVNVIGMANADSSKTGMAGGIEVTNYVVSVSVAVSPSWITLTGTGADAGKTAQATAVVTMADGSTNSDVTYTSDNAGVASVDGASGLVTPHAVGTANITATTNGNLTPTMSGSAGITVSTTGCTGSGCEGCTGSGCNGCTGSSCSSNTGITVVVTATPTTIKSSGTATCKATVTGTGTYSSAVSWSATNGSISGSGNTVTLVPSSAGTATCKAISQEDTTKSGSATVSVTPNGDPRVTVNQPSCTLSVSPTSIVVPASSVITYSCKYVKTCTMSGGGFGSLSTVNVDSTTATAKGTTKDAPTQNTIYNINCTGTESSASANASVIVTVTNPGRIETSTLY